MGLVVPEIYWGQMSVMDKVMRSQRRGSEIQGWHGKEERKVEMKGRNLRLLFSWKQRCLPGKCWAGQEWTALRPLLCPITDWEQLTETSESRALGHKYNVWGTGGEEPAVWQPGAVSWPLPCSQSSWSKARVVYPHGHHRYCLIYNLKTFKVEVRFT